MQRASIWTQSCVAWKSGQTEKPDESLHVTVVSASGGVGDLDYFALAVAFAPTCGKSNHCDEGE